MDIDITSDHHTHSHFSDGAVSIEEMALAAREKGLGEITLTDHMPLPFPARYAMDLSRIDEYRNVIRQVRKIHGKALTVGMGMEIEFIPELRVWIRDIVEMGWDRLIVSIHSIMIDGSPYLVNGTRDEFKALLDRFNNDIEALCRHYYKTLQDAYMTGWFDIAGHLDVVKKWLVPEGFADKSFSWYRQLIHETLDIIRDQGMVMEINTGGLSHDVRDTYPGQWIVREAIRKGIPIHLASDAHNPGALGRFFEATAAWCKSHGV